MARMGHDSMNAAIICQHATRPQTVRPSMPQGS
jgi:hypothetical protein